MKLNLKDKNGKELRSGDRILFENCFDNGEYNNIEDDNCVGTLIFLKGHTYFRYETRDGFINELFGKDFDWDNSECILIKEKNCPICQNKLKHLCGVKNRIVLTIDGKKEFSFNSKDLCKHCGYEKDYEDIIKKFS